MQQWRKLQAWVVSVALLLAGGCVKRYEETATLREDGKVEVIVSLTTERSELENTLKERERWDKPEKSPSGSEEEKLRARVKWLLDRNREQQEANGADGMEATLETLTLREKEVDIRLRQVWPSWGYYTLFAHVRPIPDFAPMEIEGLPSGQMRFTTGKKIPPTKLKNSEKTSAEETAFAELATEEMSAQREALRLRLESAKAAGRLTFVLPGAITETNLPAKEGNRAWLDFDCGKPDGSTQFLAFLTAGITLTGSAGKASLKGLPAKWEDFSKQRQENIRKKEAARYSDLTQVEAKPGELRLEPLSSQLSYQFSLPSPESLEEIKRAAESIQENCSIQLRFVPAQDLLVLQLCSLRIIEAVDDRGRTLRGKKSDSNSQLQQFGEDQNATGELTLELPEPGTRAVEKLSGEGVALVCRKWKEFIIEAPEKGKFYDLSSILPGATISFTALEHQVDNYGSDRKHFSGNFTCTLSGHPLVELATVRFLPPPEAEGASLHTYKTQRGEGKTRTSQNQVSQGWQMNDLRKGDKPGVRIAVPEDMQRMHFTFALEGIDFY